ncbi:MAG: SO2930 family diheme c-type cytochrome [Sandaracinaceae bacterium]
MRSAVAPKLARGLVVLAFAAATSGCAEQVPSHLSGWDIFVDGASQTPESDVIPYTIISPLFSDYANKHRFVRLPEGGQVHYTDTGDWVWPSGTVIVKTFGYLADLRDPSLGERIVETRLLVLDELGEWHPYVYTWDDDMRDATRARAGARVDVAWTHTDGSQRTLQYRVPNEVQCANCHGGTQPATPIGPRTAQIDTNNDYGAGPENQIAHFESLGWFDGPVPSARMHFEDPEGTGDLDARARAYLDANCSHCHNEHGAAAQSGLWLGADITTPAMFGVCKRPVAAGAGAGGRRFDIVPGQPDDSVMVFRMESEEPGIKMPELPSQLSHAEGVALIREWIAAMSPAGCE